MYDLMMHLENQVLPIHIRQESYEEWEWTCHELTVTYKKARSFFELLKIQYLYLEKRLQEKPREIRVNQGKSVDGVKRYIQEHYTRNSSLDTFTDKLQLMSTYSSKLFKAEVGIGLSEYITHIRIEKAKDLLLRTDGLIKTVSRMIGYPDDKYFAQTSKKQVGIKPDDFRKVYTGDGALRIK